MSATGNSDGCLVGLELGKCRKRHWSVAFDPEFVDFTCVVASGDFSEGIGRANSVETTEVSVVVSIGTLHPQCGRIDEFKGPYFFDETL